MNYTKKYKQVSKSSARSKFNRMQSGAGIFGQNNFECGFSTWWWGKDTEQGETPHSEPVWNGDYAIFVSTNYHSEITLDKMYKTDRCKFFGASTSLD